MKQKLIAENLLEWLAIKTKQIPRPMMDTSIANIQSYCILVATKLGIFNYLTNQALTVDELAVKCGADRQLLALVLNILVNNNYLVRKGEVLKISRSIKKFMSPHSKQTLLYNILLNQYQLYVLDKMESVLRTGISIDMHSTFTDKAFWHTYQHAMLELAKLNVNTIKKRIPVKKNAQLLLDIGGSHGLFGAAICQEKGLKKSIVLDLPKAIEVAKPLAEANGIEQLVEFRAFDILNETMDYAADIIFMANFLHHFDETQVLAILQQSKRCLTKNGTLAILDFADPRAEQKNLTIATISLFFKLTSNSQLYSAQDYKNYLVKLGFKKIRSKRLIKSPAIHLITARI